MVEDGKVFVPAWVSALSVLLTPIVISFTAVVLASIFALFGLKPVSFQALAFLTVSGEFLAAILVYRTLSRFDVSFPTARVDLSTVTRSILFGLSAFVALQVFSFIYVSFGGTLGKQDTTSLVLSGGNIYLNAFLVVPFVMPFAEELLFRGALYDAFTSRTASILIPSILFGFMHSQGLTATSFFVVGWTAIIGVVAAKLRESTGSIIPGFVFHATYNFVSMSSAVLALKG